MANIKRDGSRIRIRYWSIDHDSWKDIPRKEISFLDRCSDEEVEQWISLWEQSQGSKVRRSQESHLLLTDETRLLFDSFLKKYAERKGTSAATLRDENGRFYKHIVPIMVGIEKRKDVRTWNTAIPNLASHLRAKGELAPSQINKCLGLLKRFSKNLKATGIIPHTWEVEYISVESSTPLAVEIIPKQVFDLVDGTSDDRLKLLALLGFFGSLRPSESFALKKEDFLTGDVAMAQSQTYSRFKKVGFGSKLTIHVRRAMDSFSKVKEKTKKEILRKRSKRIMLDTYKEVVGEYVTIWNVEAAQRIADILRRMPNGPLFSVGRKRLFEIWLIESEKSIKVSLHDLRRASGYYLGRVEDLAITLLQDHMRHEQIQTTELYMRPPGKDSSEIHEQNFDDVGS